MKRITLIDMRSHDSTRGTSTEREIEMLVDSITDFNGYSLRFWQDVRVYGLREAILYLQNNYGGRRNSWDQLYVVVEGNYNIKVKP